MSKSILINETGGPEKMQLTDVEVGSPGPGEVKIKHTAIGLNFIDIYTRSGLYSTPLPNAVGREGAGVIVEVGRKVKGFRKGDRVAYSGVLGAYCEERVMGVDQLVKVPSGVSDEQAAATMLKGMTVEYLLERCAKPFLKKGDTILFPCGSRWRRPAVRPVGQGARLQGDRHHILVGEGRSCAKERIQVGRRLHETEHRR